jgi:predicted NUDIX family NTP pyrophosphohydrolase
MAHKKSAGILIYRRCEHGLRVFLVHPGGPFWARKDDGAWSIPKGEFQEDETPLHAAKREFTEETGCTIDGDFLELPPVQQPSGKTIYAFAIEGDCDPAAVKSNTFTLEWPKGSGRIREYPEVDRAAWFTIPQASRKMLKGQYPILLQLLHLLGEEPPQAIATGDDNDQDKPAPRH